MNWLSRFFIQRPSVVNLTMLLIIVGGLTVTSNMGLLGPPLTDFGIYTISTPQPGANAEKVELTITVPLEEELLEVNGIKGVYSKSMDGLSLIELRAIPGTSDDRLDEIERDIQRAIDRAGSRLPQNLIERPIISRTSTREMPTVQLMVTGTASEEILRSITRNLQSDLRSREDIYKVDRVGYRDRQVRILLNPQKLAQYRISFEEVEQAIRRRNVTATGGSIESFVGQQDIVVIGEFKHPEAVADVIVRVEGNGDYLRLRDIAEIVMDYEDWRTRYFYHGDPAILLNVISVYDVNTVQFIREFKPWLDEKQSTLPANVRLQVVNDTGSLANSLVNSLLSNALIGVVLITITLLIFFPWRFTMWVVAGLPTAILIALSIAFFMDMIITGPMLVAIILMLGLLVDDAIVVSEAVYRQRELGLSPEESAFNGLNSVIKPVTTGALTTIIAMCPLLLLPGHESKWLWYIPATVIFMVIGSLYECFFILPAHIAESLKNDSNMRASANWFKKLESLYRKVLQYYLARPFRSISALVVFVVIGLFVSKTFLTFKLYPEFDGPEIAAIVELPVGSSFEATSEVMLALEKRILSLPETRHQIESSYIVVGEHRLDPFNDIIEGEQSNWGKVFIRLISHNDRDPAAKEIAEILDHHVANTPGVEKIRIAEEPGGPPVGKAVELAVLARDGDRGVVADEILEFLANHPAVTRSWSDFSPGPSTIEVDLDYEKLADYGLKVAEVSKALRIAYDGILVEELQTQEELIRYRLQMQASYRSDAASIQSFNIVSQSGELVPLRNIARFVSRDSESAILHQGGRRAETVIAEIDLRQISALEINQELKAFIKNAELYQRFPGLSFHFGGEVAAQAESAQNMLAGLLLVIGGIYFLMVVLFNSLILPLITILVIPVSFLAVALIFALQGYPLTITATIGLLGLAGVLVNGALVMIDQMQKLHVTRASGHSYFDPEDIVEGAVIRLRPLLITGITTLVGLGPAAYGIAGSDPSTQDMLKVLFWGVAVGSLAILFALPIYLALYTKTKRYMDNRKARASN